MVKIISANIGNTEQSIHIIHVRYHINIIDHCFDMSASRFPDQEASFEAPRRVDQGLK